MTATAASASTEQTAPTRRSATDDLFPHGRNRALVVLLVGQFMGTVDALIVNVALPLIGRQLHASVAMLQLVVAGYVVSYAVTLLAGARFGALVGPGRTFRVGVAVFTLASLACGLAPGVGVLVLGRVVQGFGAGLMVPQVMSLIQLGFHGRDRARAMSTYGLVLAVGSVAGLLLGGVLVGSDLFGLGWRPAFLVNLPIGSVLFVLAPRYLTAGRQLGASRGCSPRPAGFDPIGLVYSAVAVGVGIISIVLGPSLAGGSWVTPICARLIVGGGMAISLLAGVLFVRHERRSAADGGRPLLDLAVLRAPGFATGLVALLGSQMCYGGFLFVFTLHLHATTGASAVDVGLSYLPLAVVFGGTGMAWRRLPRRWWPVLPPVGLVVAGASCLLLAVTTGVATETVLAGLGVGLGLAVSPLLTQTVGQVPLALAADAGGALVTSVQVGQALGVAVLGAVYSATNQMLPVGLLLAGCAVVAAFWSLADAIGQPRTKTSQVGGG